MGLKYLIVPILTLIGGRSESVETGSLTFPYTSIQAQPYITYKTSQFGAYIEGTSVDRLGNLFAVNFGTNLTTHQFGQIYPVQKLIYSDLNRSSYFASSKFDKNSLYLNEITNHKVIKLNYRDNLVTGVQTYCQDTKMIQPNDLTIANNGIIYLSGNLWNINSTYQDGDLWMCTPPKTIGYYQPPKAIKLASLSRTNGIELSYDQKYLYVSESINLNDAPAVQRIYKYNLNAKDGSLTNKTLFKEFKGTGDQDIDGMKTDIQGNLYVTRYGGSKVVVLNLNGTQVLEIKLNISTPSNLEFGGKDGKTLFIVGQCNQYLDYGWGKGCVDKVNLPFPGSQFTRLNHQ